ncbi:MAG: TolC family outer membrane protein [Sulfurospirillaceae bacterium]|nr:TolC family outer membrane protein [Sulfurospirillaceae bacterium]
MLVDKKSTITILALLMFSVSSQALTIKEAVKNILQTNPSVQERVKNYNATTQDIEIAKSGWLPTLDYVGTFGHEEYSGVGYSGKGYDMYDHSLVLVENLFNGLGTTYLMKIQQTRAAAAAYNYIEKANDVSFRLVEYYINVLRDKELLNIAKENVKITEAIEKKVQKLYSSGLTQKSELKKVKASLALANANYFVRKNNMEDAVYQLKYFYGKKINVDELVQPKFDFPIGSYQEGLDFAIDHNPSIIVQRYNIKVAQNKRHEAESGYYPKIDLQLTKSWRSNVNDIAGNSQYYSAVVKIRYNLFRGFEDKKKIEQGLSLINKEIFTKNDLIRKTTEGYDLSWNAYTEIKNQLKYLEEYKKHSIDTLTLYSKEFDLGRRSLLDLLTAQNDLINAKYQIVNAKYDHLFSKYRILDAMGTMVTSILGTSDPVYSKVGFIKRDNLQKDKYPKKQILKNDKFLETLEKNNNK